MDRPSTASVVAALLGAACLSLPASAARDAAPGFSEQSLELPGVPAAVIPADMNGDGREDLVVLVAYTAWGDTATTEQMTFDDIEGLVEVMNVVSALVDHRELRVYLAGDDGRYRASAAALELDASIHVLEAGAAGEALLAVTDEGVAAVRFETKDETAELSLVPLIETETSLAGTGAFFPGYSILAPLDDDSAPELLLPTATGWSVFRGTAEGFDAKPASRVPRAEPDEEDDSDSDSGGDSASDGDGDGDSDGDDDRRRPRPPIRPVVADQNADDRPDLLVLVPGSRPVVYLNLGDLAFSAPIKLSLRSGEDDEDIVYVGSLDGGVASSVVSQTVIEPPEDAGMRPWIEHAKQPDFSYRVYPLDRSLGIPGEPRARFLAEGYTFAGEYDPGEDLDVRLPGGFKDLDGDGRQDLVAITLEFSILPMVMRVLITRRAALTMDFHPWCQQEDGSFRRVPGLDLSGRFKINLRNVQVKHLSQFAGDFDGDGRADFVQLGRGKKVTIHQGRAGCRYPARPDRSIRLSRKLRHLGLARVLDLDGDGRSDLYVVHPLATDDPEVSIPARVDLYLSRL